jgi:RNA polymerase sigma-70 factor (ECF subfamily)
VEPTDSEVVAESLSGRPEAFATVVRRHGQAVHGYLARRSDRQTADDLFGEVWLRAFRSRHSYDQQWSNARPWLYGIANNTLRAHWRLRQLQDARALGGDHDLWSDADARLDALRQGPMLREALAALHPEDRKVLLLVAWERLSPAEIAVSLGMPQGTVRWRLHRARKLLREHFNHDMAVRPFATRPKEA